MGRVTSNGEIEVNGKTYTSPSRAGRAITQKGCNSWYQWCFKDSSNEWSPINILRDQYREHHKCSKNVKIMKAS